MSSRITASFLDFVINKVEEYKAKNAQSLIRELEETRKPYQQMMLVIAEEYVKELIKQGVLDVTAGELLERTDGFDRLDRLTEEVLGRHLEEAKRILSSQLDDVQSAYSAAESSITGSGVSVYTSSALTLMATSALESGILKGQAEKADKEFSEACAAIEARASNAEARNDARAFFGEFLPSLSELMLDLCGQLFSAFLAELVMRGFFNFDVLKDYNLQKAEKMLGNIKLVPNPEELLQKCFDACPYCADVYNSAFDLDVLDASTYETAKLMGATAYIDENIAKKCRESADDAGAFERNLAVFMASRSLSRRDALKSIFQAQLDKLLWKGRSIVESMSSDDTMGRWLASTAPFDDATYLVGASIEEIESAIEGIVDDMRLLASRCRVNELGFCEFWRSKGYPNPVEFETVCVKAKRELPKLIFSYAKRLTIHHARCRACAKSLATEADARRRDCDGLKEIEAATVKFFESRRKTLGLLDTKTRDEIAQAEKQMEDAFKSYREASKIEQLRSVAKSAGKEARSVESRYLDMREEDDLPIERRTKRMVGERPDRGSVNSAIHRVEELKNELSDEAECPASCEEGRAYSQLCGVTLMIAVVILLAVLVCLTIDTGYEAFYGAFIFAYAASTLALLFRKKTIEKIGVERVPDLPSAVAVRWFYIIGIVLIVFVLPLLSLF